MSKQDHIDKIQYLIKDIKYTMMTTVNTEGHMHAWPMTNSETSLGAKEIWFIGDKNSDVVKDLRNNSQVCLSYSTQDEKNYVSITGHAELPDDKDKLDELWEPIYNAYFEHGKEDPDIQLIKIIPRGAEYWMSGSSVANMFKMVTAAVQDGKTAEDMGENHTVEF